MDITVCTQFGKQQSCVCRSLASISEWTGGSCHLRTVIQWNMQSKWTYRSTLRQNDH